jgi:DNA end-binding protein Ku
MAQTLWSGVLSFGLVNIPVDLRTAENPDSLDLDLLDRRDLAPVGYKPYNKKTDENVPRSAVVKGLEISDGKYVLVEKEDLERANVKATQTIEIVEFVGLEEIDPRYFERPYYVTPRKGAHKAYALLREALGRQGKAGLARLVIRTREHLAAVYPVGKALVVNLLRYAHELRNPAHLDLPAASTGKGLARELAIAEKLIEAQSGEFRPERFKDEYRDDLLKLLKKKATSAVEVAKISPGKPAEASNVRDLMSLLERSIEGSGGERSAARASGGKRRQRRQRRAQGARTARRTGSRRSS